MRKKQITVLEILIVILVLSIAGGLIGARFYSRRNNFSFFKNIEKLNVKIAMAQHLALFNQRDFVLDLQAQENENKLFLQIYPLQEKENIKQSHNFSDFYFVFIDQNQIAKKQVKLFCTPHGDFYPPGKIRVSKNKDFSNYHEIRLFKSNS